MGPDTPALRLEVARWARSKAEGAGRAGVEWWDVPRRLGPRKAPSGEVQVGEAWYEDGWHQTRTVALVKDAEGTLSARLQPNGKEGRTRGDDTWG